MTIKNLIGYQLVSINSEEIIVKKDDKEYTLRIIDDYGACCGFNDITTELLISKTELQNNPIITNVELEQDCGDDEETAKLTFFGMYRPIATVDTLSSSGSGWGYGACVTVECEMLGIKEKLSSW